jgi:O-antigen chain-terminating methyltransferase
VVDIQALVRKLPDPYQPIYGYPELSYAPLRPCADRLATVAALVESIAVAIGRSLRILDLGCAQGFFSFELAKAGHSIHGIDMRPENMALLAVLRAENPALDVSFSQGKVECAIDRLHLGDYDFVLGLSVFHHICFQAGAERVTQLLGRIATCACASVVELALKIEPAFQISTLPEDERQLLREFRFVHELGRFPSNTSRVARPLFACTNSECFSVIFRDPTFADRTERFGDATPRPAAPPPIERPLRPPMQK